MWTIYPPGELLKLWHAATVFTFSVPAAVRGIYHAETGMESTGGQYVALYA